MRPSTNKDRVGRRESDVLQWAGLVVAVLLLVQAPALVLVLVWCRLLVLVKAAPRPNTR